MSSRLHLDLTRLADVSRLSPTVLASLAEAASVMLDLYHPPSPTAGRLVRDGEVTPVDITWPEPSNQQRETHANEKDAAEDGGGGQDPGGGMDMTNSLEDPRGRQSEALAFEAERARKAGDEGLALALFAQSAELEAQVAREVPAAKPRVRSVLAISAVALWLEARRYVEAARTACEFLARPELLTEQGNADLEALLERAFRERGTAKVMHGTVEIEGVLKVVNLRARRPYIGVETADGDLSQFFIERGQLDDTIGPKLNRRVRVSGVRRQMPDGRVVKDALDVALVEGKAA